MPTLNMPLKTCSKEKPKPRRKLERIANEATLQTSTKKLYAYDSFAEPSGRVKNLKLQDWSIDYQQDRAVLRKYEPNVLVPKYELCIDDSLGYYISVYCWQLPTDHPLYTVNERSMRNITVSSLVKDLQSYPVCSGISMSLSSQHTINHVIPKCFDPHKLVDASDSEESLGYHFVEMNIIGH